MRKRLLIEAASLLLPALPHVAGANVYITEFCSDTGNNEHFEFVEVSNVGATSVDMTGWSEDDSHATPNQPGHVLSGLGTLSPGESGIITEATPSDFRNYWGASLLASVPIVGPYTNDNLSTTGDSITLFNSTATLVDHLDYTLTNGGTADSVTRNAPLIALGKDDNALWATSFIGDAFGSFHAAQKPSIIGNPGFYPVPEPTSAGLIGAAGIMAMRRRRRT